jgi:hypothetical protein
VSRYNVAFQCDATQPPDELHALTADDVAQLLAHPSYKAVSFSGGRYDDGTPRCVRTQYETIHITAVES